MDFEFIFRIIPQLIITTRHTISLAVLSLFISLTLAIIISSVIYYNIKNITPILKVYVSFFRGTPALCQLYLIYFGLGNIGIPFFAKMTGYTAVVISLSLNMSAYMAENSADPHCGAMFLELGRQVIPALYPAILSTSDSYF